MAPVDRVTPAPPSDERAPSLAAPTLRACPYLTSASRAWVASGPSVDHRCEAVAPAAALSLDKQRRLCLTADHGGCATFLAARAAREARHPGAVGPTPGWGWVRTTPVVDRSVGLGASVTAMVAERRAWQVIPAIALVAALGALGLSNIGARGPAATPTRPAVALASSSPMASPAPTGGLASVEPSVAPTGTPTPTAPPTVAPTAAPPTRPAVALASSSPMASPAPTGGLASVEPSVAPTGTPTPTAPPTVAPTTAPPTPTPAPASRTYKVKANDTLYGIARQFGVTVTAIKSLNGLTSNVIHAGQILKIP